MKNSLFFIFFLLSCLSLLSSSSFATTYTWKGGPNSNGWDNFQNWSPNPILTDGVTRPRNSDNVIFNAPTVSYDIVFPTSVTVKSLTMLNSAPYTYQYTLKLKGHNLTVTSSLYLNAVNTFVNGGYGDNNINITNSSTTIGSIIIENSTFESDCIFTLACPNVALDQAVKIVNSTIKGEFTLNAKKMYIHDCNFTSTSLVTITKKDATNSNTVVTSDEISNCTFGGVTNLYNEDNQILYSKDNTFNNQANLYNQSSSSFLLTGTNTFNKSCQIFNSSTGHIDVSSGLSDVVNFNSSTTPENVFFSNSGSGTIKISNQGEVNFNNSSVVLGSTSTGNFYIGYDVSSPKLVTLKSASKFYVYPQVVGGVPYFSSGTLSIDRFVAEASSYPLSITPGVNATLTFPCNLANLIKIHRPVTATFYNCTSIAGEFNGNSSFTLMGSSTITTNTCDQLTFNADVSIINQSMGNWSIGGISSPLSATGNNHVFFNSPLAPTSRSKVTLHALEIGDLNFGKNPSTIIFKDVELVVRRISTVITTSPGSVRVGGTANINITSTPNSYSEILIDQNATNTGKKIYLGSVDTYLTGPAFGTTTFNGVFTTQSDNGTLINYEFKAGTLSFGRFIANRDVYLRTPTNANIATTVELSEYLVFEKNTDIGCANIIGYGGVYGAPIVSGPSIPSAYALTTKLTRIEGSSGSVSNNNFFIGTPVFNSELFVANYTHGAFIFGNTLTDEFTFNSHVNLSSSIVYNNIVKTSGFGKSYYRGNLIHVGVENTVMAGESIFDGLVDQTISSSYNPAIPNTLKFGFFEIVKPSANNTKVILAGNTTVGNYTSSKFKLTHGNIVSSSTNLLTLLNDVTPIGGGAHSFVEGPLRKIGNTPFMFHVGKPSKYFPLSITAPSSTTSSFTTEFFDNPYSSGSNNISGTVIKDVLKCLYWQVDKNSALAESVALTLSWNNNLMCYPVNPNIVSVARFDGSSGASDTWLSQNQLPVSPIKITDVQPEDIGTVQSDNTSVFGVFSLGYRNALVINTIGVNPTIAKATFNSGTKTFNRTWTSGTSGTSAGNNTILSDRNDVPGKITLHPNFSTDVNIDIDQTITALPAEITDNKATAPTYELLKVKTTMAAEGVADVATLVKADEGSGSFIDMSPKYYKTQACELQFFKETPKESSFVLKNNLSDGVTFTVNKYITLPYPSFQITDVPNGITANLEIKDISGNVITNTPTLIWDGKNGGSFSPEGLYTYDLAVTVSATVYHYKGQLILKYQ